jgi:N-acylneuraminate cytidylyltransferase
MTIAIIPARAGSVGIKDKNIRPFCGVPLLVRAIHAAKQASSIDSVIVTTDSEVYAELSRAAGADVVIRPPELATSTATSESAVLHVLERLKSEGRPLPESLVFLQCTSPLTRAEDIDGLVKSAERNGADTALTVVRSHRFLWCQKAHGDAEGVNHDKSVRLRRQDRETEFMENGAAYFMRTEGFLKHRHRFFGKTFLYELPDYQIVEIDSEDDWSIAEAIATEKKRKACAEQLPKDPQLVVFDFDGVFTDNRVLVHEDGSEAVFCDRGDGLALGWLRAAGLKALILSKEKNKVVSARAKKVGIPVAHGVDEKALFLRKYCQEAGVSLAEVVYLGNDVNDLECFDIVGCAVAVGDAVPEVKAAADIVLQKAGGRGAIRELIEMIPCSKAAKEY